MIISSISVPPQIGMKIINRKPDVAEIWGSWIIKEINTDPILPSIEQGIGDGIDHKHRTNMEEWNTGGYEILNYDQFQHKPKTRLKFI